MEVGKAIKIIANGPTFQVKTSLPSVSLMRRLAELLSEKLATKEHFYLKALCLSQPPPCLCWSASSRFTHYSLGKIIDLSKGKKIDPGKYFYEMLLVFNLLCFAFCLEYLCFFCLFLFLAYQSMRNNLITLSM